MAKVGGKPPSGIGTEALLDFRMEVTLEGETLTESEIAKLLASSSGLHFVRGRWVEVDRDKLAEVLERFRMVERTAADTGLSFAEAMRLISAADVSGKAIIDEETQQWSRISAGDWLAKTLETLRHPESALARVEPGEGLQADLRPYQRAGFRWLHLLSSLGLGACLADDMGLGKTMQVLALMVFLKKTNDTGPSILVAPSSLLENWALEISRFAPGLQRWSRILPRCLRPNCGASLRMC
jgi:non-specific serine/threonine protein kinase